MLSIFVFVCAHSICIICFCTIFYIYIKIGKQCHSNKCICYSLHIQARILYTYDKWFSDRSALQVEGIYVKKCKSRFWCSHNVRIQLFMNVSAACPSRIDNVKPICNMIKFRRSRFVLDARTIIGDTRDLMFCKIHRLL